MNLELYEVAQEDAIWRAMSHFGRFLCHGKDAGTLLHHLTTNDILNLQPSQGCDAVLVSNKARVLDLLVIHRLENAFWVLTSPNRRALFAPHARKFVGFRQEIEIEDVTDASPLWGLFGPRVETVLQKWQAIEVLRAPHNVYRRFDVDGVSVRIARTHRLPGEGILVTGDSHGGLQRLVNASHYPVVDDETYNVLRVEHGVPAAGLELTEEVNPWEAELDYAISLHKGCYNGQEVIARLNTYQKVKQRLRGLKLGAAFPMGPRADLLTQSRSAGFLTSSVISPRFGPIALGYVRNDFLAAGQALRVVHEATELGATVAELPFA